MIEWGWIDQCDKWMYEVKANLEEVLVEYDGPYLAIFSEQSENLYFGIFCDYIGTNYRWLLASVSNAERMAIISGMTPLKDVFEKKIILVCDFDDVYSAINVWHCKPEQVPVSLLPKPNHPLPSFARRPIHELIGIDIKESIIKLDGYSVKKHSLPFKDFGHFLVIFQEYWEKLSKSSFLSFSKEIPDIDYRTLASLSFCAASEGSIDIHFKSTYENVDASNFISETLKKMRSIDENGVPSKMVSELGNTGLKDASKMHTLLHSSGIDMLLVSEQATWFVGSEKSGKIARAINKTAKAQEKNQIMRGHFCAGRSKKSTHSFEFVDEATGTSYKGKISPIVWRYNAIAIGEAQFYEVEIEVFEKIKGDQAVEMAYTLVRADKLTRNVMVPDDLA